MTHSKHEDAFDWKATFLSKPSVSVRKGTADNYETPFEDTSTLVLTAYSGKFVDIRFPHEDLIEAAKPTQSLTTHPSFWAFSGVSTTTFYDPQQDSSPYPIGFSYTAHTIFKHDIDSKGPGISDEGDCFLLPNGDVMEIGISASNNQLYKEVWTDPDPLPGRNSLLKSPVIVAETTEANNGRGMIIRIGDYIQGIFERAGGNASGENIIVERVIRRSPKTADLETMEEGLRRLRSNDSVAEIWVSDERSSPEAKDLIPSSMLARSKNSLEMEFSFGGNVWKVTEYA